MNIMDFIFALLVSFNALAAQGCTYNYQTFTWTCPPPREFQMPVKRGSYNGNSVTLSQKPYWEVH